MAEPSAVDWLLGGAALAVLLTTFPYLYTVLSYRHRDNGLAYITTLMGVGFWNGMVAAQLVAAEPLVDEFFFALAGVGALLTGLGWFLFACTASSTRPVPGGRTTYAAVALLVGVDVVAVVTAPVHSLYWTVPAGTSGVATTAAVAGSAGRATFAAISTGPGYWLHLALLGGLFAGGAALFAEAWRAGVVVEYTRAYAVVGVLTAVTIILGGLAPGGASIAPLVAAGLTTVGWHQARRGGVPTAIRS